MLTLFIARKYLVQFKVDAAAARAFEDRARWSFYRRRKRDRAAARFSKPHANTTVLMSREGRGQFSLRFFFNALFALPCLAFDLT